MLEVLATSYDLRSFNLVEKSLIMRLANWWIFLLILVRTDHFSDGLCTSRRFANRILNRGVLHLSDNVASDVEIEYAPMTPKDIPKLAKMISKYFDGPYSWWQRPSEIYSVWTLECQLSDRFEKFMVHKERQHVMLVARVEGEAIGYVEVGLVPLSQELRDAGESALNMQWGQTVSFANKFLAIKFNLQINAAAHD